MNTFEYDVHKEASNIAKHGISFTEAQEIFSSPDFYTIPSQNNTSGEDRFLGIGTAPSLGNIVLVVYTHRPPSTLSNIRIISARRANAQERTRYETLKQNFPKQ
jgi:uncharacterized protein